MTRISVDLKKIKEASEKSVGIQKQLDNVVSAINEINSIISIQESPRLGLIKSIIPSIVENLVLYSKILKNIDTELFYIIRDIENAMK